MKHRIVIRPNREAPVYFPGLFAEDEGWHLACEGQARDSAPPDESALAPLQRWALRQCSRLGGTVLILNSSGEVVQAWEGLDAREFDESAPAGTWIVVPQDPSLIRL